MIYQAVTNNLPLTFPIMHDELNDELVRSLSFVVCCGGLDQAEAELPALYVAPVLFLSTAATPTTAVTVAAQRSTQLRFWHRF